MKKYAIFCDLHGDSGWKMWVKTAVLDDVDKFIFLGDYVDSLFRSDGAILRNLKTLIALKKKKKDKVVLLIGNHELHYIFNPTYNHEYRGRHNTFSGYRQSIAYEIFNLLDKHKDFFQVAYQETPDSTLFTHAGVTQMYYDDNIQPYLSGTYNIATLLNEQYEKMFQPIFYSNRSRGGVDPYSGPFWADFELDLKTDAAINISQIVGHSPNYITRNIKLPNGNTVTCLDVAGESRPYVLYE